MHADVGDTGEGLNAAIRAQAASLKAQLQANHKLVLADAVGVVLACGTALLLSAGPHFGMTELAALPRLVALVLLVGMPVFTCFGFYRRHARSSSLPDLPILVPGTATALLVALWIEHATDLVPEAPDEALNGCGIQPRLLHTSGSMPVKTASRAIWGL